MAVIARLKVNSITDYRQGDKASGTVQVSLSAVYSEDKTSPNYSFSQATPSAQLTMAINNSGAYEQFAEGDVFDLTFIKVEV